MRLILFLLFPVLLSGQILRPYGVIEIGANFPTSSATGPKFAYRTVDSSFYRWVSGNTWIKIIPALPLDSLVFNPTTADPDTAELKYSADLETFWFGADGTTIEIGQKTAWYVKNQTGSTITKGTVVRASGTLGSSGRILVSPMVIDGTVDSKYLLGVAASDIANGSDGYVIHFGKLRKFNTSSWADGTVLYAGTGGTLTSTQPNPPNLRLPIAFVVHSHATNGILAIRIQTGNELHELHDVDTTGIDNGGVIVWNAASEKWEASNGAAITTADTTSLLATKYWTNSNFFPIEGGTLTGTGGAGFIGFPSQVTAPGTPASGLNVYAQGSSFNWKGTDGHERQFASTLTGGRTYTLPNTSGTFALGTGTATRIPIWTSTNALGDSPILYNATTKRTTWDSPGVIELPMGTDAQRPSPATTSDFWYNTTGNGIEWYNGTRWAKGLESAFNRGTATRIPFFDANGQVNESANLTYTGTRFQTGGSIRFGLSNTTADTASIEKIIDVNSKIVRINNPGGVGGWSSGFVFRGGFNGGLSSVSTFRIYTNSTTLPGSVYVGNVTEGSAQFANGNTNLGIFNKITTANTNTYDTGVNMHAGASNLDAYSLTNSKHFGFFIGGQSGTNFGGMSSAATYGVFAGYQYQPLINGYGSSWVFVAKNDAATATEVLRLQGKDGNICLGCTNAQYKLYTTSTDAYGLPRGTVAQRPTIVSSTTPFRYNTDSTALEYGESVGTWRQIATRAYARSLVAGLGTGTVTSVGLSLPSIFSVSGSPVTTSGTLSATFTGGSASQFLRGDGRWMKSLYFNSSDSIQFNITDPYFGSTALVSMKGNDSGFDSRWNVADYGYINQSLSISSEDDTRYIFDRSRGTIASPTALLKADKTGGIYFRPYNGSTYQKAGYIGAIVDSVYSGGNTRVKLIFGISEANQAETSSYWRFLIESSRNISVVDHVTGSNMGVGFSSALSVMETAAIEARFHVKGVGTTTGKTMLLEDSGGADILTITDNKTIQAHGYGAGTKEAADLSKTQSNYIAGFATDGTVLDLNVDTLLKKEKYFTITSTSSPQTLSNTISDNLINQGGTQATFTLTFPASPVDGQVLKITYNNAITTLTLDGNGNTIVGSAVTTGVAGSQRAFKFYTGIGWIKLY